jgi:Zn-dependent metalloprotease
MSFNRILKPLTFINIANGAINALPSLVFLMFCIFFQNAESQTINPISNNFYKVIRLAGNNIPAILEVNKSNITRKLSETERSNIEAVRNFAKNEAQYIAANVLSLLGDASLEELGTQRTGNLWLSSFGISYNGIPLRERYLRINIGALFGEVILIRNNIPVKEPNMITAGISGSAIVSQIRDLLGSHSEIKAEPYLVFLDESDNPTLRLCYEVTASEPDINEMWRLTFDATTGKLIEKKSLVEHDSFVGVHCMCPSEQASTIQKRAHAVCPYDYIKENPESGISGKVLAKVHLQSPYDTLTTVALPYALLSVNGTQIETDSTGTWSLPSVSYPLSIQTSFNNKFFSILRQDSIPNSILTKYITSGSADVLWDNSNSNAAERDAFYSVSIARLADKRVDENLTGIDLHMNVKVNFLAACNAFYIVHDTSINFFIAGPDCSNTAEISDIVFHEYGHRVTNARYTLASGKNANIIDGSLSEGFADLNSAFIRDDPRIGIGIFGDPKINSKIIRSCDNTKKWPRDISPDIHISGQIIAGAFWDLRKRIGRETAEHLFHFMEYQMPDGIDKTDSASLGDAFTNTLFALLLTDDDDNDLSNGTPHLKEILASFNLHNITLEQKPWEFVTAKTQEDSRLPYPNPVRHGEKIHLQANSYAVLSDLLGRTIATSSDEEFMIPNSIPSGIYYIEQSGQRFKIVVF